MTVRVGVMGPGGRMGRMLLEAITEGEASSTLAAAVDRPGSSLVGTDVGHLLGAEALGVRVNDDLSSIVGEIDVLIDFTLPEATLAHAQICAEHDVPMVIGTTGFTDDQTASLQSITAGFAVCQSSNFAPGVNLTFQLVEAAARALGDSVDVEIVEAHHRHKIDAPSGTALSWERQLPVHWAGIYLMLRFTLARAARVFGPEMPSVSTRSEPVILSVTTPSFSPAMESGWRSRIGRVPDWLLPAVLLPPPVGWRNNPQANTTCRMC